LLELPEAVPLGGEPGGGPGGGAKPFAFMQASMAACSGRPAESLATDEAQAASAASSSAEPLPPGPPGGGGGEPLLLVLLVEELLLAAQTTVTVPSSMANNIAAAHFDAFMTGPPHNELVDAISMANCPVTGG
jgi:hypothetical protein